MKKLYRNVKLSIYQIDELIGLVEIQQARLVPDHDDDMEYWCYLNKILKVLQVSRGEENDIKR